MKKLRKIVVLDENSIEAYERCTCIDWCLCNLTIINNYDRNNDAFKSHGFPSATYGGVWCTS